MSGTRRIDPEEGSSTDGSTAVQTAVHPRASGSVPTSPAGSERAPVQVGSTVGRYVVLDELGRGGMGRVLRAYDPKLEREVALKEVHGGSLGHEHAQRLVVEARAMAKLSHPNVVAVYDVEQLDATSLVLVMEYVPGRTLGDWLAERERGWPEIVQCFLHAGQGLAAAHAAELLHRDFKPANVLVGKDGAVKVTDFGLAKGLGERSSANATSRDELPASRDELTQAGTVLGTPRYMALEQVLGEPLTPAADQYAFCVALWEALCGAPPFTGDYHAMAKHKLHGPPPWPGGRVPPLLGEAIRRGLSPKPEARWPTMEALLQALRWDPNRRRRRFTTAAVGLAVLASAGVGWHSWTTAHVERCAGARARLAGIWDEARRTAVESAMLGVEAPYAAQAWERTGAALDEYASAWAAMHTEACEATAVRGEQSSEVLDLRMACLQRASVELGAAVELLADADAEVVERAHEVIGGLRPLSRCADGEALRADVEPPAPADAETVEAVRRLIEEARAALHAGRYPQARSSIEAAEARLGEVAYGPVRTEILLYGGQVLEKLADYDASEAKLRQALQSATEWRQWDAMASATRLLIAVTGFRLHHPEQALRYRELGLGLARHQPRIEAGIRSALGLALTAQGQHAHAEEEQRRALALLEQALGPDDLEVGNVINNLASLLIERGALEEAEALHRRALALREQALGPSHPSVAQSHANLGYVLAERGRFEPAEAEHRRAIELFTAASGPMHPDVATSQANLANLLVEQGRLDEAEAEQRRVLAIFEVVLGAHHPQVAMARSNLANTLRSRGQPAEAEAEHRRALAIFERAVGPEHLSVAAVYSSLGSDLRDQGKLEEAEVMLRKALTLRETLLGPEHPDVARSHHNLGRVLRDRGDLEGAAAELRRGLSLREAKLDPDHPDVAQSHHGLAEVLLRQGRPADALVHAERAWERRQRGDLPEDERAHTAFLLAQALWATASDAPTRARARTLAEQAREGYEQASSTVPAEERASLRQWLAAHESP